jgi:phosphoglucomutase/phosphomannomutase
MYPIGSNAINDRTIGESAQGLADYVHSQFPDSADLACAIAYDTRHQSRHFAELCSEIMAAAGFKVWFLDGVRSTPELSFAVRYKRCTCGIMVTASHNPPSDNAVKVYWSTGGQVLPPHDAGIIDRVMNCGEIHRVPFEEARAAGKIEYCQKKVDPAFVDASSFMAAAETTPAIIPGKITRNGNNIFGKAAISGVRRAAVIESAAIARCTTRKSVHQ